MAANIDQIYLLNHFAAAPVSPVSFSTANPDVTGASGSFTTVVQGGTNGSVVASIVFYAVSDTSAGTTINIYHNHGGTRRLVGQVPVPANTDPTKGPAWTATWGNPNASYFLASGDKYDACPMQGAIVFVAIPIGGDY